jgi:hypothetical protein
MAAAGLPATKPVTRPPAPHSLSAASSASHSTIASRPSTRGRRRSSIAPAPRASS